MADINDYLDGLNYTLNAEEKQLMDIFAECWEHCHNIKCENCEYRSADEYGKMLICMSYQYAKRLIDHGIKPVKHAKWAYGKLHGQTGYYCSECGTGFADTNPNAELIAKSHNYCPNCGAKMDGDTK